MSLNELRPVEALYLLSEEDVSDWDENFALGATLSHLLCSGLITVKKRKVALTSKANSCSSDTLRSYEIDVLDAIGSKDYGVMFDYIDDFDFDDYLLETGFYNIEDKKMRILGFFNLPYSEYVLSSKGQSAMDELKVLKNGIKNSFRQGVVLDDKVLSYTYAFSDLVDPMFHKFAKKNIAELKNSCSVSELSSHVLYLQSRLSKIIDYAYY